MGLRNTLKRAWRIPALRAATRGFRKKSIAVLMYHNVVPAAPEVFNWCLMPVERFREQMACVADLYHVLPLAEVVGRMRDGLSLPDHTACITFDDAFRGVYHTAWPVLKEFDLPATVFVVTSLPETQQPPWAERLYAAFAATTRTSLEFGPEEWSLASSHGKAKVYEALTSRLKGMGSDERLRRLADLETGLTGGRVTVPADSPVATMSWEEIEILGRGGLVEIGSHAHEHEILSRCATDRQRQLIRTSRERLRSVPGYADLFAYPNGDFTDETKAMVRDEGYQGALTTRVGLNRRQADIYELRRVPAGADFDLATFEFKLLGF